MKRLFFIVFIFFMTNLLYAANFTVIDFMALDGAEQALVSGAYDTFTGNFKPAGFTQISKFKVRKTAQDMGIQLSTASPQQMKPVMDKLKVTHIVFGKVRKINSEYVVTVSFIKAGTDAPLATDEAHFSGSHVEPVKALAQNLAKKLRGGNGGGKTQAAAPAKVLNEPGIIYGYLKVFPKDLGPFPNDPEDIINNINAAQQFGYNTWRVPTENELALLATEGYIKNAQGYMSDANGNGKLRLVTDKKTAKELAEEAEAERKAKEERLAKEAAEAKKAEEEARRRAEEERLAAEEEARRCDSVQRRFPCTDRTTGYMWSQVSSEKMNWRSANRYCENLDEGGFSDWQLPSVSALETLIRNGTSKFGDDGWFWSSNESGDKATDLMFSAEGSKTNLSDKSDSDYVRCVRENGNQMNKKATMSDEEAKNLYMEARAMKDSYPEEAKKILQTIIYSVDFESIYYRKAKQLLDEI